jgi:hypothetical protein
MRDLAQELDEIFQALHRERLSLDGFLYELLNAE